MSLKNIFRKSLQQTVLIVLLATFSSFSYAAAENISGIVNKYVKGKGEVDVGTTKITVTGSAFPSAHTFLAGQTLLLLQSQGAQIDASNTDKYGNGVGTGGNPSTVETSSHGSNEYAGGAIAQVAGRFEYAEVLSSTTGTSPGDVVITLTSPLKNSFSDLIEANWQLIVVPDYATAGATLTGNVTAHPWNGDLGGVVAFSATDGDINFAGFKVDAQAKGFRGGVELDVTKTTDNTAQVVSDGINGEGGKGEGIAGTPLFVYDGSGVDHGIDARDIGVASKIEKTDGKVFFPTVIHTINPTDPLLGVTKNTASTLVGGDYGRGSPGNAGGGAGPHNSGGGGGSNAGDGGGGAQGYVAGTPRFYAGYGGQSIFAGLNMGGGGGSGEGNNGAFAHGGVGGGIVLIKALSASGTGEINVSGGTGHNDGIETGDGGGGGGAAGSAVMYLSGGIATPDLTINAVGGAGAFGEDNHGSGGGGGGGYVIANTLTQAQITTLGGAGGPYKGANGNSATSGGTGLAQTGSNAFIILNTDYGDAPASYGTESGAKGAYHQFADYDFDGVLGDTEKVYLGLLLDGESGGIPSGGANTDNAGNLNDEDGIRVVGLNTSDTSYSIPAVNIRVTNTDNTPAILHAWVDFDGNGSFDADEYTSLNVPSASNEVFPNQALVWSSTPGLNELFTGYPVYARFRISTDTSLNASSAQHGAVTGEVEDYVIALNNAAYTVIDEHLLYVDGDLTQNAAIGLVSGSGSATTSWNITGGNDTGLFALDLTGNLTAAKAVSFANQDSYVFAADDSSTSPATFTKITVFVRRLEVNLTEAYVGTQLKVSTDTMALNPEMKVSYQWHRNNAAISGATSDTYILTSADINNSIKLIGTYRDSNDTIVGTLESGVVQVLSSSSAIDKIKAYADNQAQPIPTEIDYEGAGVVAEDITQSNLSKVNEAIATKTAADVDSTAKVQIIVDAVNTLEAYLVDANLPKIALKPTVADLANAGLKDVTSANLDEVLTKLDNPLTDTTTLVKQQVAVDEVNLALTQAAAFQKIKNHAATDGVKPEDAPVAQDFLDLGIAEAKVTAMNVAKVNAAIAKKIAEQVDSKIKVEAIIDAVNTLDAYAGSGTGTNPTPPTKEDFDNGGYTGVQAVEK